MPSFKEICDRVAAAADEAKDAYANYDTAQQRSLKANAVLAGYKSELLEALNSIGTKEPAPPPTPASADATRDSST